MTCDNDWTLRFPEVDGSVGPLQLRPLTLSYKESRTEWAYLRTKFPTEVGDMLKPETRYEDGLLYDPTVVEVRYNDETVRVLYFRPHFADYGNQNTYLEFHDLQESMDKEIVDRQWHSTTLENAYTTIFEKRQDDHIQDIGFTNTETVATELIGRTGPIADITSESTAQHERAEFVSNIEADQTRRLVSSEYAVDLDKVSPGEAIQQLNETFGVTSWVDANRTLWIGFPEAQPGYHVAAPDDPRVWRYSGEEVNISHPREPILAVVVGGPWVDASGIGTTADLIDEMISWFDSGHEGGAADVLPRGIAHRTDIDYGQVLSFNVNEAKRDALPEIAASKMRELMKQGNHGTVEVIPDLSGSYTSPHHVRVGDLIHLVPDDKHFDSTTANSGEVGDEPEDLGHCSHFVNNEVYLISDVQHDVDDSGYWSVTLDVGMYPDALDDHMETSFHYFDPNGGEFGYYPDRDVVEEGLIESDVGV